MDGFKNTTKTRYDTGNGYAMGGSVKGAAKVAKVMGEFKGGKLHSGSKSGPKVTNPKQATAIAMSEARKAGAKTPVQEKGLGGVLKIAAGTLLGGPIGGLLVANLIKKKKSGVPLTPVEEKKLVESGEDTTGTFAGPGMPPAAAATPAAARHGGLMKHGGMMKKKGVPVAPRGPLVGLSVMPRGKK